MIPDSHNTLHGYRLHLKEKLDCCFTRGDGPDPGKRFARVGVTKQIFESQRLIHLFQLLLHTKPHQIGSEVETPPQVIADKIRGTKDSRKFCNVLATLLYGRCDDETLLTWAESLLRKSSHEHASDDDLPLTEAEAQKAFGFENGLNFWEHQSLFCPVILEEGDESVYVDRRQLCPLPFTEEPKWKGQGSYATVYIVKIERGHLVNRAEGLAIQSPKEYAQKVFFGFDAEAKKSFEAEGTTIKKFIQAAKSHENILVTKASLERHGTYSLFFELAECSLDDYFSDHKVNVTTLREKRAIISRTPGLAGALAYLHDELYIASTGEQLRCYHLDLKPQNILIFHSNGNHIWKISDFGISQIKRIPLNQEHLEDKQPVSVLDWIFRRGKAGSKPSSGVTNSRYGGTYAAPEARQASDKVTRKTDIWSLACVLSLVLTYLDNGSEGIRRFEEARSENRDNDRFYESPSPTTDTDDHVHASVPKWLASLAENAQKRHEAEGKVFKDIVRLLQDKMLLVDESSRCSAKEVEHQLKHIQATFPDSDQSASEQRRPPEQGPLPKPPEAPSVPERISGTEQRPEPDLTYSALPKQGYPASISSLPSIQQSSLAQNTPYARTFQLPHAAISCEFSQCGRFLASANNEIIATNLVADIQEETKSGEIHLAPAGRDWSDYSLGSAYLCAAMDSPYFECSIIPLSRTGSSIEHHVQTNVEARIQKIVMSPNDEVTAFVLEEAHQGKRMTSLALYRTKDMLGLSSSSSEKRPSSQDNSSRSISTHSDRSREDLPWPSIAQDLEDFELPATADLVDLKFSSSSQIVMAITKPYRREHCHIPQYTIMAWDVTTGRKISMLTTKNEGAEEEGSVWEITAFALSTSSQSFAAISNTKIRTGNYGPLHYQTHSHTILDPIIDILPNPIPKSNSNTNDSPAKFIIIGRERHRPGIRAFRVSSDEIDDLKSLSSNPSIEVEGIHGYEKGRDCAFSFYAGDDDGRQILMVASINREKQEGKLVVGAWEQGSCKGA